MINSKDFVLRLEKIIEFYGLSASTFAEQIGVQRSSISHILSGRNKPSLEFVMKLLSSFPEVDLYWLLNGKGTFPKLQNSTNNKPEKDHSSQNKSISKTTSKIKKINRIVIFYSDGSFENFEK